MTTKIVVNRHSVRVFRMMLSGIFLVASFSHVLKADQTVQRIPQARFKELALFFGNPETLVLLSGIVMFLAGLALFFGYHTRWAAVILAAVLVPITLTVQVGQLSTLGPLFKNIAILGGLLFFILNEFKHPKN